jgi:hypothetical protein
MSRATKKATTILAVLAVGAIAAPGASAQLNTGPVSEVVSGHGYGLPDATDTGPISEVVSGHGYGFPSHPSSPAPTVTTSSRGGFDWGDAGIGAAAMLSLLGLAGGATVAVRRTRGQQTQVS